MQTIILTAEELIALMQEKKVKTEKFEISSNSTFIALMARLAEEMSKRTPNAK